MCRSDCIVAKPFKVFNQRAVRGTQNLTVVVDTCTSNGQGLHFGVGTYGV